MIRQNESRVIRARSRDRAAGPVDEAEVAIERGKGAAVVRLLLPLAKQGHARAQTLLGQIYVKGNGVRQDYSEAAKWYWLAADQGVASAQDSLARLYAAGHGVTKDAGEAARLFRVAVEQGLAGAQSSLGYCYEIGDGLPQNNISAYMWYELSASRGDSGAVDNRNRVAQKMKPEEIAEAKRLTAAWKAKSPAAARFEEFFEEYFSRR